MEDTYVYIYIYVYIFIYIYIFICGEKLTNVKSKLKKVCAETRQDNDDNTMCKLWLCICSQLHTDWWCAFIYSYIYIYIYILVWTCQFNWRIECGIDRSVCRIFSPDWYVEWIDMCARSFSWLVYGTDCQVTSWQDRYAVSPVLSHSWSLRRSIVDHRCEGRIRSLAASTSVTGAS